MNPRMEKAIALMKEYKELAATIVFFAGGVLWIFGYFATKEELRTFRETASDQNKTLHCLLQKHVQLLGGKQILKTSSDDLAALQEEIRRQTPSSVQFSDSDVRKIVRLEQQRDEIKSNIAFAEKEISDATKAIMSRMCER